MELTVHMRLNTKVINSWKFSLTPMLFRNSFTMTVKIMNFRFWVLHRLIYANPYFLNFNVQ
jgi:hypothetical protein